jgi:hypothetical protein
MCRCLPPPQQLGSTWQIWSYSCGWRSQKAWKAIRLLMVAGRGGSSSAPRPPNSSASTCACGRLSPAAPGKGVEGGQLKGQRPHKYANAMQLISSTAASSAEQAAPSPMSHTHQACCEPPLPPHTWPAACGPLWSCGRDRAPGGQKAQRTESKLRCAVHPRASRAWPIKVRAQRQARASPPARQDLIPSQQQPLERRPSFCA